jgi:hypothetical protein
MKVLFAFILLTVVFYVPTAWAQCTTGIDTGGQCIPPDALDPQGDSNPHIRPQQPAVVWSTRWGAIAIDNGTSSVGVSENQVSKSAASAESLQRCTSKSNSQHCEVQLAYYNQCAALAWGTRFYGISGAVDTNQAKEHALERCAKGAVDCKIVYSTCSLPVRVQ